MTRLDYKTDKDADERLNPASELSARESAASADGLRADSTQEDNAQDILKNREDQPWKTDVGNKSSAVSRSGRTAPSRELVSRLKGVLKKRGAAAGLLSVLGVSGGLLAVLLGQSSMLVNLMENITINNDSVSVVSERRLSQNLMMMMSKPGLCSSKKMSCRATQISNKGLRRIAKVGIIPIDSDGNRIDTSKRTGFPKGGNPVEYEIDGQRIKAEDLPSFLSKPENRRVAAKLFGRAGAFNMRFRTWAGKYMAKKFFDKFDKIKRNGGAAQWFKERQSTPTTESGNSAESSDLLAQNLEETGKLSESDIDNAASSGTDKVNKKMTKAKRGGVAYLAAVAGCVSTKMPRIIAAGVAGVQLLRIVPQIHNFVLSVGSQVKAGGTDPQFSIQPEGMEFVGKALTDVYEDPETGVRGSALDSPYLLAALGVSKSKLTPNEKYAPGLSIIRSPAFQLTQSVEGATSTGCDIIMSDAAMYTAMAADAAVTIATAPVPFVGAIKVVGSFVLSEIIAAATEGITSVIMREGAKALFAQLAGEDIVATARGTALGHVLGHSAFLSFSAAAGGAGIPVLPVNKLGSFDNVRTANEELQKEYDLALLSPFDMSSRHTFLGSLAFRLQRSMLQSGNLNSSIFSVLSNLMRFPAMALSPRSASANISSFASQCVYAEDFGMNDSKVVPAINIAGSPCRGITEEQASMDPEKIINDLEGAGWLNGSVDIEDGADVTDLMNSGYIAPDTAMSDFQSDCTDDTTGNYLFNATGCITDARSTDFGSTSLSDIKTGLSPVTKDDSGNESPDETFGGSTTQDDYLVAASSVAAIDIGVRNKINGFDDDDIIGGDSSSSSVGENLDNIKMFYQVEEPWKSKAYGIGSIRSCGCGPTSMASIVSSLTTNQIDPENMAKFFVENNGQSPGCGSIWIWESKKSLFKERFGINIETVQPSAANAIKGLEKGGLVLISANSKTAFTSSGHIMFIRGKTSDGKLLVGDPASRSRTEDQKGFGDDSFVFGDHNGTRGMWIITAAGGSS